MVTTDKMEIILEKCQIIKEFAPLPSSILGYYYCNEDYYIILINESIKNNERLYRSVLAEEIGHYRTTIGDITPRMYMCYRDRIEVDRHECIYRCGGATIPVSGEPLIRNNRATVPGTRTNES